MLNLETYLSGNTYPGRGVLLGRSADNRHAVIAYFIMGRSENSRNRIFEETEDGIRTRAFDESRMTDPSLIIYHPVRKAGNFTVVTNGDQTDTVAGYLKAGRTFEEALRTRTFEPDGPNWTPRISGLLSENGDYRLSILKSADGDESSVRRFFYEYESPKAGAGHLIHTYEHDGSPIPSFSGEPRTVELPYACINCFTKAVWESLDPDNKVSLFTRFINLKTGETVTKIVNKHA